MYELPLDQRNYPFCMCHAWHFFCRTVIVFQIVLLSWSITSTTSAFTHSIYFVNECSACWIVCGIPFHYKKHFLQSVWHRCKKGPHSHWMCTAFRQQKGDKVYSRTFSLIKKECTAYITYIIQVYSVSLIKIKDTILFEYAWVCFSFMLKTNVA